MTLLVAEKAKITEARDQLDRLTEIEDNFNLQY